METRNLIVDDLFSAENIRNCENHIISIQRKLDKAVADCNIKGIRETFDLLAKRSTAVKILAIHRITRINKGKYTAGVDGIKMPKGDIKLQSQIRHNMLDKIDIMKKPDPIRRVYIPKPNGKKRPLGIPTIQDRIIQDVIRIAIEPIVEYHFSNNSYGFRPKRCSQDACEHIFKKLCYSRSPRYILEGDIKGCFDNINHEHIINTLLDWNVPKWATTILHKMLKSGIFHNGEVYDSEQGTPQGGVISPLLANVALTTLDNFCESNYGYTTNKYRISPIVRYADDFVIICKSEPQAEQIKEEIAEHISQKVGLTLSEEKSNITHITKGFNFLGFNFRKYKDTGKKRTTLKKAKNKNPTKWSDYTLLIKPEKSKILNLLRDCKKTLETNQNYTQADILKLLNPKLRGWAMYYRHVNSARTFATINHELWWKLYYWAKRRHPNKSNGWIIQKYFSGKIKGSRHIFRDKDANSYLTYIPAIPIRRFVKVNNQFRVYDKNPETIEYWRQREYTNAFNQIEPVRTQRLFRRQKGICPHCNGHITKEAIKNSDLHTHHIIPKSDGGDNSYGNLQLIHSLCHKEIHKNNQ